MHRPQARTQGLIAALVEDGLVVFDEHAQAAHSFSAHVTAVWTVCDGTRTTSEIAVECGLDAAVAEQAIDELSERGLLEGEQASARISRREGVRRLAQAGGAALAAPLIYSVAINPAMAAASTCSSGCADYVQIAASSCNAPSPATSGTSSACQSGTCYRSATGNTYTCAPAGCLSQGLLNCNTDVLTNPDAAPCCAGPSACRYVPPEETTGCYT